MYSLLIDTHDKNVLFVLYKDGNVLDKVNKESNMRHSEIAMPSLIDLIERNGLKINDLKEIITVVGPGSFTGVRIGVTIAKTLAYLLKISIRSISSIDLLYFSNGLKKGIYGVDEKNGSFIAKYDGLLHSNMNIKYYSDEDFVNNFQKEDVIKDVDLNFNDIYKYFSKLDVLDPHLINPIYVKQIEVEKW